MKKLKLTTGFATVLMAALLMLSTNAKAQYTGVGLLIDVGEGTVVGPHIKHFLDQNSALEGSILFGSGTTIQAMYGYHMAIPNADGLKWYIGAGPAVSFSKGGGTDFSLAPMVGLDYKINQVPLALSADWRPRFFVNHGSYFDAARFALGLRFTF